MPEWKISPASGVILPSLVMVTEYREPIGCGIMPILSGLNSKRISLHCLRPCLIENKWLPDTGELFHSGILGFDPGFGTADTFVIRGGTMQSYDSFDNLGMKMVYKRLSEKIWNTYGVHIPVHTVPKVLIDGYVQKFDKKNMRTENIPVADMLEQCNKIVCEAALEKLNITYDYLQEFKHLLVTGGTGEAWCDYIANHFAEMQNLKIIFGNRNDAALPQIFSNVRGYYLKRAGILRARQ